jgi:ferrous iron transport protein B
MIGTPVQASPSTQAILVIGRESVGKSQLISSLTGRSAGASNFRGSTVHVESYDWDHIDLIDTPGIHRRSDSAAVQLAMAELEEHDHVLLVVQATQLDDDLAELLPLVAGKTGLVVVTFWDKVQIGKPALEAVDKLSQATGVPFVVANGRHLLDETRDEIRDRLDQMESSPRHFSSDELTVRAGWRIEPTASILNHPWWGLGFALVLLLAPALATIFMANTLAGWLHPIVTQAVEPLITRADAMLPSWLAILFTAKIDDFGYGLLNMGPFLLVWAFPTVVLFALILGIYKSTGLIEHINSALHPWSRHIGLSGRDLVRVMMGFGCNVPAVVSIRACSGCSRGTAVSAIAFGSACSYQLPVTLAVLAAVSQQLQISAWILPFSFLLYLMVTTCIYLRLTSPRSARSSLNLLMQPARPFLQWPSTSGLAREVWMTIKQFLLTALPTFAIICIIASILTGLGFVPLFSQWFAPIMQIFNLPAEAALTVVMASIRKDGIFLLAGSDGLSMPLTAFQVLTAVYLAGVLLPCVVTALTIRRETGTRATLLLLGRQAAFAIAFSIVLAWTGKLIEVWS